MINPRISFSLRLAFLALFLGACSPQPKTVVDIQTEKVIVVEHKAAAQVDDWQAQAANVWEHCGYKAAYDTEARVECQTAWHGGK
jgi:hypothetical protein